MTTTFHRRWRDAPESAWRWPNFSPAEIACRGTGKLLINEPALDRLQALRDRLGKPLIVRSAYRSPEHNRAVGGATRSKHLDGAAFDIAMANHDPVVFETAAREVGFLGFGFYPRSGFIHVDLGPARQWGERFPVRATAFAAETPPAREVLAESRTMKGWWRGGRGDAGCGRRRGCAKRPGRDPDRHPAARALPRHAPLGVHRRGARRHRSHDLRAAGRLEAGRR